MSVLTSREKDVAIEAFGPLDEDYVPQLVNHSRSGTVVSRAPGTEDQWKKPVAEIVKLFKSDWAPQTLEERSTHEDFFTPINAEGAREGLKSQMMLRPNEFIDSASLFFDREGLDPHYTYAFLRNLYDLIRENKLPKMKTLIVGGNGHVGQALSRQLSSLGHSVSSFSSKDARSTFVAQVARSDVVFIAIPTRDTGETALGYHLDALKSGKRVITCEKGALAYHYEVLKPYLQNIGYTATVGGGSRMLSLFRFPHIRLERIVGVVNGTLNFLFSECAKGRNPYEVLAEAQRLGLCEPGKQDLANVVNGEIRDILLKLVILFNCSGVSDQILHVDELGELYLSESEILNQLRRKSMRFAVSISKAQTLSRDVLFGSLHAWKGEWCAEAALADMSVLPFKPFPQFQENTLLLLDYAGTTQIFGKGAGAVPTASTMVSDMASLLN